MKPSELLYQLEKADMSSLPISNLDQILIEITVYNKLFNVSKDESETTSIDYDKVKLSKEFIQMIRYVMPLNFLLLSFANSVIFNYFYVTVDCLKSVLLKSSI